MTAHARATFVARLGAVVVLTTLVSACKRGCLSAQLTEREGGSFDLGGSDCSEGLARCVGGRVETSVFGHVPHPCTSGERRGGCECPWQTAAQCPGGCVKEGLEVVATAEVARVQLCLPAAPPLRAVLPNEAASVSICAEESASCVDGIVRTCAAAGQPARLVAACVSGCARGISVSPGDLLTNDGAAAILCGRAHAERR